MAWPACRKGACHAAPHLQPPAVGVVWLRHLDHQPGVHKRVPSRLVAAAGRGGVAREWAVEQGGSVWGQKWVGSSQKRPPANSMAGDQTANTATLNCCRRSTATHPPRPAAPALSHPHLRSAAFTATRFGSAAAAAASLTGAKPSIQPSNSTTSTGPCAWGQVEASARSPLPLYADLSYLRQGNEGPSL